MEHAVDQMTKNGDDGTAALPPSAVAMLKDILNGVESAARAAYHQSGPRPPCTKRPKQAQLDNTGAPAPDRPAGETIHSKEEVSHDGSET